MSHGQDWKTIGLEILRVHHEDCGDGSCGCGCGDIPVVTIKFAEKAPAAEQCCEPACGPETCA